MLNQSKKTAFVIASPSILRCALGSFKKCSYWGRSELAGWRQTMLHSLTKEQLRRLSKLRHLPDFMNCGNSGCRRIAAKYNR